jgi:predicted nucleic acid-binding protein
MRFVDTNIFIYALTAHPTFGQTAKRILERIEKGEEAVTSTLVLCEISWVLEAMGKQGTPDDILVGANNMAEYGVDFNDGVNIALMMRLDIREIYSNDQKHLGKLDFLKTLFG